jgi:hypothetical protein
VCRAEPLEQREREFRADVLSPVLTGDNKRASAATRVSLRHKAEHRNTVRVRQEMQMASRTRARLAQKEVVDSRLQRSTIRRVVSRENHCVTDFVCR